VIDKNDSQEQQRTTAEQPLSDSPFESSTQTVRSGDQGINGSSKAEDRGKNVERATADLDSIRIGEWWLIAVQVCVLITGIAVCVIYGKQLTVMKSQLDEMKSGSADTHELAVQAKNQADRTKDVADRALLQANATNALAKEAERSADLSEATSHLDERAWVGPSVIGLINAPIEANKEIQVGVNFCNSGKTPALNLLGYADGTLVTSKVTVDFSKFVTPPGLNKNVLFPGGCHHFQRRIQALPQPLIEDIEHGASKVIIFGLIRYKDVFRRQHWTHFCMSYSVELKGFGSCGSYNETDDQE
jgi:hypothetical protein